MPTSAVYRRAGGGLQPFPLAAGPWDPGSQHGGPIGAVLASAMESFEVDGLSGQGPMMARVTVDLLRPVPMERFDLHVEVIRNGRRAQRLAAHISLGDVVLARATGLRVERVDVDVPSQPPESVPPPPDARWELPEFLRPGSEWQKSTGHDETWVNFVDAFELRVVQGSWDDVGRCTAWGRLSSTLIEGEPVTPLQRVMAFADFSSGCGTTLSFDDFTFPNADLSVHLYRQPSGDWIGMDSLMSSGPGGVAVVDAQLFDQAGPIGRALQTCIVSER